MQYQASHLQFCYCSQIAVSRLSPSNLVFYCFILYWMTHCVQWTPGAAAPQSGQPSPAELAGRLLVCWLVSLGVGRSVVWWSVCWLVVCRFARSPLHSAGGADKWRGVQIIQNTRQTLDRILSGSSGSPARLQRSPRPRTQTRTHNTGELQKYPASGLKERNKGTTDLITGRTARTRENPRDQQYCEVLSQLWCRPASLRDRFNDHCPAFECECHHVSVPALRRAAQY